ncbi:hypothetical protein STEG23_033126, partial [Scotinomys teguina]
LLDIVISSGTCVLLSTSMTICPDSWNLIVHMVYYIDRFLCVEPSLHLWDKAYLIMVNNCLMCSWMWFANILSYIFASMYMREIALNLMFPGVCFSWGRFYGVLRRRQIETIDINGY